VRTRSRTDYDLIVRESDDPDQRYILVVGVAPQFDVVGWIVASDARLHPEWRQSHGGREEAWFVPQLALNPIETCRHMLTH
jgi:hypothetical protein